MSLFSHHRKMRSVHKGEMQFKEGIEEATVSECHSGTQG